MNTYEWKPIPMLSPENGNHGASCGSCNSKLAKPKDSPVSHHRLTAPLLLLQQHPQTWSSLHKAEVLHQLSGMHGTPHSSSHRSTISPWASGRSSPRSPPTLPTDQRLGRCHVGRAGAQRGAAAVGCARWLPVTRGDVPNVAMAARSSPQNNLRSDVQSSEVGPE